jgi:hypothetical protein
MLDQLAIVKQQVMAMSNYEAEYIAATSAATQAL